MALHSNLTGADLHEPKGADSASNLTVYQADGAGSGNWGYISTFMLDSSFKNTNSIFLCGDIADLSTGGSSYLVPIPVDMTLQFITFTLANAITGSNGLLVITNPGVGTAATISIGAAGSTEGTTGRDVIVVNNNVTAGSYIKVAAVAGSTGTCKVTFVIQGLMT